MCSRPLLTILSTGLGTQAGLSTQAQANIRHHHSGMSYVLRYMQGSSVFLDVSRFHGGRGNAFSRYAASGVTLISRRVWMKRPPPDPSRWTARAALDPTLPSEDVSRYTLGQPYFPHTRQPHTRGHGKKFLGDLTFTLISQAALVDPLDVSRPRYFAARVEPR